MKNLNIYTFRELIKMYIDERPMPDVAFVTQTEAMKLQSMGKEMNNNSEWITDRRPTEEDADSIGSVWATYNGEVFRWDYQGVGEGMAWMPITPPDPYVKPKRYVVQEFDGLEGVEYAVYSMNHKSFVAGAIKTREAAESIAAIYEEMMP